MTDKQISVSEAAVLIGTDPKQVRRLIKRGVLIGHKVADLRTAPFLLSLNSVNQYITDENKKRAAKAKAKTAR